MVETELPFEIWQHIVHYAVDPHRNEMAGYTADALAATNRMLRQQVAYSTRTLSKKVVPKRMVVTKLMKRKVNPSRIVLAHLDDDPWLEHQYTELLHRRWAPEMTRNSLLFLAYHHPSPLQCKYREFVEGLSIYTPDVRIIEKLEQAFTTNRQWLHVETAWKYRENCCFCCHTPVLRTSQALRYVPRSYPITFCSMKCMTSDRHLLSMVCTSQARKEYLLTSSHLQSITPAVQRGPFSYYYRSQLLLLAQKQRKQPELTFQTLKRQNEAKNVKRLTLRNSYHRENCRLLSQIITFNLCPPLTLRAFPHFIHNAGYWHKRHIPNEWFEFVVHQQILQSYVRAKREKEEVEESRAMLLLFLQLIGISNFHEFKLPHTSCHTPPRDRCCDNVTVTQSFWANMPFQPWDRNHLPLFFSLPVSVFATNQERYDRLTYNQSNLEIQNRKQVLIHHLILNGYLFNPDKYIEAITSNSAQHFIHQPQLGEKFSHTHASNYLASSFPY